MTRSAEQTRARLLAAARAEFASHGIAGARVDRIAARAGVNKERIYGHFGSKEKLFELVVDVALDELITAVSANAADPAEYVGKLYDYYQQHPDVVRLLLWDGLTHSQQDVLPGPSEQDAVSRRRESHVAKFEALRLSRLTSADSAQRVALTMLTLIGVAIWPHAVPQLRQLMLAEPEGDQHMRDFLMEFTRNGAVSASQST